MSANMRVGSKLPFPLLVLGAGCVTGCSLTADGGGPVVGSFGQALEGAVLAPGTALYAPKPQPGSREQFADLMSSHQREDARLIKRMANTPQAVWLEQGTPKRVMQQVRQVVNQAADQGTVPVLVAYNIPFRDCAQYSAGGATTPEEYLAWIDGVAKGIGDQKAAVILEPDGLGIIPWYNPFGDRDTWLPDPNALEWCQPPEADPAVAAADRFAMLRAAVTALKANPATAVYLDGTHSGWLGAGDAADRLLQAGVKEADGFFLNVSNYQSTERQEWYGTWIAKCIWFADPTSGSWGGGHAEWCASQYYPANPSDLSTWGLTDAWYAQNVESQYADNPEEAELKGFVIDTSRNGQGPWVPPADHPAGDPQDWCNPPDRGLGLLPTTDTGHDLVDAYLWIKTPGESDGQCTRWGAGPEDPVREMIDPAAGVWFPEQALELVHLANPPRD